MNVPPPTKFSRSLLATLVMAAVYYSSERLALLLAIPPGYATAVWPAAGFALAGVLLEGYRIWPGILVGSLLVNLWTSFDATTSATILKSVLIAASLGGGAALEAIIGAACPDLIFVKSFAPCLGTRARPSFL